MRVLKVLRVFEGFNCDIFYGIICAPSKVEECRAEGCSSGGSRPAADVRASGVRHAQDRKAECSDSTTVLVCVSWWALFWAPGRRPGTGAAG